jgi:hypothetical protein
MPVDPLTVIAEILGEPAESMRNPANAEYRCPFINSECIKKSHRFAGPYPVCTVYGGRRNPEPICVCPMRFYEAELQRDILNHCWVGKRPSNPRMAYEVTMAGFGKVDFVLADIDKDTGKVKTFISVELQAVDITGSYESAYTAVLNGQQLEKRSKFGFNWGNVRKRYVSQLISKGFFHHQWGARMVAVMQTAIYHQFRSYIHFDELDSANANANIIFLLYRYDLAPEGD